MKACQSLYKGIGWEPDSDKLLVVSKRKVRWHGMAVWSLENKTHSWEELNCKDRTRAGGWSVVNNRDLKFSVWISIVVGERTFKLWSRMNRTRGESISTRIRRMLLFDWPNRTRWLFNARRWFQVFFFHYGVSQLFKIKQLPLSISWMPLSSNSLDRLLLNFYAYHGSNVQYCSTGANQDDIRLIITVEWKTGRNVKWKWLEMSRIVGGKREADLKADVSIARGE
jgi:hypothetical protein